MGVVNVKGLNINVYIVYITGGVQVLVDVNIFTFHPNTSLGFNLCVSIKLSSSHTLLWASVLGL